MDEARKLIQCLKGKNVIGGDVACLMPSKDNLNQITFNGCISFNV